MRRAPLILWKALGFELGRLLVLTTSGLVLLISFAAAVKPLADGKIGLPDMLTLMVVLAVPMLQFALPFAAGFAATFAYHRFVSDREAMAAMATGISHRALLVPALSWAVVLAAVVALLTNTLIPGFLRSAERVITRDIARVITTPLEQGQTLSISDWDVHAQRVTDLEPAAGSAALDHLVLEGVMLTQREGGGYVAASRVDMWLYDALAVGLSEPGTAVGLVVSDPSGVLAGGAPGTGDVSDGTDDETGGGGGGAQITTDRLPIGPLLIPTRFDDDPKYLTFDEMRKARLDPTRMNRVASDTRRLAAALGAARAAQQVQRALDDTGRIEFSRSRGGGERETVTVFGAGAVVDGDELVVTPERPGVRPDPLVPGGSAGTVRPVRVLYDRGGGLRTLTHAASEVRIRAVDGATLSAQSASAAFLGRRDGDAAGGDVLFNVTLLDVSTTQPGLLGAPAETSTLEYNAVSHPEFSGLVELVRPPSALIDDAALVTELTASPALGTATIERAARRLRDRLVDLEREILSKTHERVAFTLAAFLMVLTGGVMAMKLKDELPLQVYVWSFLPALVSVITISSGQSMTHKLGGAGLILMYAGVAALALFTLREYRVVSRH